MKSKLRFFFILLLSFHVYSYSQIKTKANYSYLLYLPRDCSKQTNKYPLVIYLHGASQRGNDLNKLKGYGLPYLIEKGQNFDFIIASPQCPDDKYWTLEDWFDSLYLDLITKYKIDSTRVYVTGISMGGYGVYGVGMDYPDKFAALIPLCGGCFDSDTSRICNLKNTPIWAFHGTADTIIPISETERIVNALKKCNGNIKYTRLENEGHHLQFLYEKNPEIYEWMLKQKK